MEYVIFAGLCQGSYENIFTFSPRDLTPPKRDQVLTQRFGRMDLPPLLDQIGLSLGSVKSHLMPGGRGI